MSRIKSAMVALLIVVLLSACGNPPTQQESIAVQARQPIDTSETVQTYIEEHAAKEAFFLLDEYSNRPIAVTVLSDGIYITFRAFASFCIPEIAESFVPVVKDAISEVGTELGSIQIQYYRSNSDGMITDSLVSWSSDDGEKGTFVSMIDSFAVSNSFITGCTIEQLYEHYQEQEDGIFLCRGIIEESGGDPDFIDSLKHRHFDFSADDILMALLAGQERNFSEEDSIETSDYTIRHFSSEYRHCDVYAVQQEDGELVAIFIGSHKQNGTVRLTYTNSVNSIKRLANERKAHYSENEKALDTGDSYKYYVTSFVPWGRHIKPETLIPPESA